MSYKYIKNVIVIFILTIMISLPLNVQAVDNKKSFISGSEKIVNTNIPKGAKISSTETVQAPTFKASNYSASTLTNLESIVKNNMNNRVTDFSVDYTGSTSGLKANISTIIKEILSADDYLNYSYTGYGFDYSGYVDDVTINFTFEYLTTKSQESLVDSKVNSILGQIINSGMTSDQKEKSIHDYIVKNVEYDTSLTRYSAYNALYEGKTVCQGYALLAYKMLKNVGIEVKIISGTGTSDGETESHAWNLVKLSGKWYHLDCTWDDPVPDIKGRVRYDYYNLPDSVMQLDHTWDHSLYPSATTVYVEPTETPAKTSVSGVKLSSSSLVLKIGQSSNLTAAITPSDANNPNVSWTSSDPSVASVDSNGNIKSLKEGHAVISVKTEDGGYSDSCGIDVVSNDGVNIDFTNYKKWNNSPNAAKNKAWSVKFTKPFDAATINTSNVLVYEQYGSLLYPVNNILITHNDTNDTIYVKPSNEYTVGKTYNLVITQKVLSKDGEAIPKPIVVSYTVTE